VYTKDRQGKRQGNNSVQRQRQVVRKTNIQKQKDRQTDKEKIEMELEMDKDRQTEAERYTER
jgi:hypothetical protein